MILNKKKNIHDSKTLLVVICLTVNEKENIKRERNVQLI